MMAEKHYLTAKELRKISRENMKTTAAYEKKKKQKVDPATYAAVMKDPGNVLEIEDLHTFFFTDAGIVKSVNGVSFEVPQGKIVGVVGESGCGKSVTSLSIMQLVQAPQGQIVDGEIRFKTSELCLDENKKPIPIYEYDENGNVLTEEVTDKHGKTETVPVQKKDKDGFPVFKREDKVVNIAKMPTADMRKIRGREISMIFQEPMTSLNPVFTIGYQLDEVILVNTPGATREDAKKRSIEMLTQVGIAAPESVYSKYPHELSGGMRQRVMIAMAVSCEPRLLIADEPTTALDVTIQAQILELMCELREKMGTAIMLITHDMGVVAETADDVLVLYAGKAVEYGNIEDIFERPKHPYTQGLLNSIPRLDEDVEMLNTIEGTVPAPDAMPAGCRFAPRCPYGTERCMKEKPGVYHAENSLVSCFRYEGEK